MLRKIFKRECRKSEAFQASGAHWDDDSKEQRDWIADRVKSKLTSDEIRHNSIKKWDVTKLSAALKVVMNPVPEAVDEIRDCRNILAHLGNLELTSADFKKHEESMKKLIEQSGFTEEDKEWYREELNQLTSSELQLCCSIFYCIIMLLLI